MRIPVLYEWHNEHVLLPLAFQNIHYRYGKLAEKNIITKIKSKQTINCSKSQALIP